MNDKTKKRFIKGVLIILVLAAAFIFIGLRFLDQTDEKERRIFYNTKLIDGEVAEKKGYFIKPITIWSVHTVDVSDSSVKEDNLLSSSIRVTYVGSKPQEGKYNFSKDDGKTWWYIGGEQQEFLEKREKGDYSRYDVNNGYAYLYRTDPWISLFNTTWYIIPRGTNKAYPVCRDDGTRIYTPTGDDVLNEKVKKNILSGNKVDEKLFGVPEMAER